MVLLMYFDTHHNHTKAFISEREAFVASDPWFSEEDVTKKIHFVHRLASFMLMKMPL